VKWTPLHLLECCFVTAFLAVLEPGFITANVDNDPGGILIYSQAGAKFGDTLLWTLIPTAIALVVVQEMAARMGAVTGKGLSDLIRVWCGTGADPAHSAHQADSAFAGGQRSPAAVCLVLHAEVGESRGFDGRVQKLAAGECDAWSTSVVTISLTAAMVWTTIKSA
jgi:natural resistance-associated macrophage protein